MDSSVAQANDKRSAELDKHITGIKNMKACPFIEGMTSQQKGMRLSDNPYNRDNETFNYCQWIRGFNWNMK